MQKSQFKTSKRQGRHARIRGRVSGTANRPRLAVFKSNTALYAQIINDETATTIVATDSRKEKGTMAEGAAAVGTAIATQAKAAGVTTVVFDRGGFKYQGNIAILADAARAAGLEF